MRPKNAGCKLIRQAARDTGAHVRITKKVYRGRDGYLASGKDVHGRNLSIFGTPEFIARVLKGDK